jgi:hypothetical protein
MESVMIKGFDFEHDTKTYHCSVEPLRGQAWWWFNVSGDPNRYAPFHAAGSDTRDSVKTRIVEYYANHIARRLAPPVPRGRWQRQGAPATPAVPAPAAAPADPVA